MSNERAPLMTAFIAKPKAGKSTLLVKMIENILRAKRRILVIDPDGGETLWYDKRFKRYDDIKAVPNNFNGVAVVMYSKDAQRYGTPTFDYLQAKLDTRNYAGRRGPWAKTTVIMDDANRYCKGQVEPGIEFLLQRKRQYGVDIIVTAHNWHQLPPIFYGYVDLYIIGPTLSGPEMRSDIIKGDAQKNLQAVRAAINAKKAENPAKNYPWAVVTADGTPFQGEI
jgi:hypothetical protein